MAPDRDMDEPVNIDLPFDDALGTLLGDDDQDDDPTTDDVTDSAG
jgi:hypothetical protein